jgi:hypothetical protein
MALGIIVPTMPDAVTSAAYRKIEDPNVAANYSGRL